MNQPPIDPEARTNAAPGHEPSATISRLPSADRGQALRILEARLFAATKPLTPSELSETLSGEIDVAALLEELKGLYAGRGVNLVQVDGAWMFRTADDLAYLMQRYARRERKLSKAALETLAIIAYHQPVTRADIEDVRGVATAKGTLDTLMALGWVRPRGRRRAPGRPVTYGTTQAFLAQFTLSSLKDLPGLSDLKGAGLLSPNLPPDFQMPEPCDVAELMPDEMPLEPDVAAADLFDPEGAGDEDDALNDDETPTDTQT